MVRCAVGLLVTCVAVLTTAVSSTLKAPYRNYSYSDFSSISVLFNEHQSSFGGIVDAYELSYRSTFDPLWHIHSDSLGSEGRNRSEAQIISIKVDDEKSLYESGGTFTLGIGYAGLNPQDFEHAARTPRIPWNATASQLRHALASLVGISVRTVKRCDEFGNDEISHGGFEGWFHSCPYGDQGGFRWLVVFDALAGNQNFPKLYSYRENLGNTWSGGTEQVSVTRIHGGAVSPSLCRRGVCSSVVRKLEPSTPYVFRYRAHLNIDGWTDYSVTSEPIFTAVHRVPSKPRTPHPLTSQANSISFSLAASSALQTVHKFESQFKESNEEVWNPGPTLEVTDYEREHLDSFVMILGNLKSGTQYVLRVRAVNAVGVGPWSSPSNALFTKGYNDSKPMVHPPVIEDHDVTSSSVLVTVRAEPDATADVYTNDYRVQYKPRSRTNWLTMPDRLSLTTRRVGVEVQEISVRSDSEAGCQGRFYIELRGTLPDLVDSSVTTGISFDATEEEFVNAVLSIPRIRNSGARVSARRVLNQFNGYTWILDIQGMGNIAKFLHNRNDLTNGEDATKPCWTGAGYVVSTRSIKDGIDVLTEDEASVLITGLEPQTAYDVRAQRVDARDSSLTSSDTVQITTKPVVSILANMSSAFALDFNNPFFSGQYAVGTSGNRAARREDFHYAQGSAAGGKSGEKGADGLCVIVGFRRDKGQPYFTEYFFYSGREEEYVVPYIESHKCPITRLTIKCWGAGGGGGVLSNYETSVDKETISHGGGGAFAQATLAVQPGERFRITVGGGGSPPNGEYGGNGGFGGGGRGGNALKGGGGGGGGGASVVTLGEDNTLVLVAAGGGGGGSTDYCCSGGGGGGGAGEGERGSAPEDNTPWPLSDPERPTPVKRRHEYTAESCPESKDGIWCTSPWDIEARSLPAEHLNLEYGESPNANYSLWSQGGFGGTLIMGGSHGVSGGYEVVQNVDEMIASMDNGRATVYGIDPKSVVNPHAQQGRYLSGGRGAGGKKGGGGGGSGYFGGGGGGSGIDAAGGGGGSSYVNEELTVNNNMAVSRTVDTPTPTLTYLSNSEAELSWSGSWTDAKGRYAKGFEIEMAFGNYSEDFTYIATVNVQTDINNEASTKVYSHVVSNLESMQIYSFRIIPLLPHGRGSPSGVLKVLTLSAAQNYWEPVVGHRNAIAATGRGLTNPVLSRPHLDVGVEIHGERTSENPLRVTDAATADIPVLPSSRRGHSLTLLDEFVYMFGGRTDGYTCAYTLKDMLNLGTPESGLDINPCATFQNEVSELWRFNIYDYRWVFIPIESDTPSAREQHSAGMMDGNIYIFGGKSRGSFPSTADTVYSDFWRLNVEPRYILNETWRADDVSIAFREGQRDKFLINITDGQDPYVTGASTESSRTGACISDIVVVVKFAHPCISQLRISLQGPGPSTGSPNFHPHSYEEEVLLFDHTHKQNNTACARGNFTFVFDEDGIKETLSCCETDGIHHFKPDGSLYEYIGASPFAEWTLVVEDMNIDGQSGELIEWGIEYSLEPCNRQYSWTEITTTSGDGQPSARYQANMIVHEHSLFLFGGRGEGDTILSDLHRYDMATNSWTVLKPRNFDIAFAAASMVGMSLSLTKWGLIRFGGYIRLPSLAGYGSGYVNDVYIMDPVTLHWRLVEVENDENSLLPAGRYLSSAVFIPSSSMRWRTEFSYRIMFDQRIKSTHANFAGALMDGLLIFGGHNGATGSLEDGSTGGMLNDMWQLRFANWSLSNSRESQNTYVDFNCKWRTSGTSALVNLCLSGSNSECELRDLIMLSWCAGSNQTIA